MPRLPVPRVLGAKGGGVVPTHHLRRPLTELPATFPSSSKDTQQHWALPCALLYFSKLAVKACTETMTGVRHHSQPAATSRPLVHYLCQTVLWTDFLVSVSRCPRTRPARSFQGLQESGKGRARSGPLPPALTALCAAEQGGAQTACLRPVLREPRHQLCRLSLGNPGFLPARRCQVRPSAWALAFAAGVFVPGVV